MILKKCQHTLLWWTYCANYFWRRNYFEIEEAWLIPLNGKFWNTHLKTGDYLFFNRENADWEIVKEAISSSWIFKITVGT
jgi:hypothetical protein